MLPSEAITSEINKPSIIFGKPDVNLLEHAPALKWLQNPSAGGSASTGR